MPDSTSLPNSLVKAVADAIYTAAPYGWRSDGRKVTDYFAMAEAAIRVAQAAEQPNADTYDGAAKLTEHFRRLIASAKLLRRHEVLCGFHTEQYGAVELCMDNLEEAAEIFDSLQPTNVAQEPEERVRDNAPDIPDSGGSEGAATAAHDPKQANGRVELDDDAVRRGVQAGCEVGAFLLCGRPEEDAVRAIVKAALNGG